MYFCTFFLRREDVDKENAPPREDARNNLSDEDREKFNSLVLKAREFAKEGDIQKALKYNQRAYSICKSEKLAKRIEKMEVCYIKHNSI